MSQVTLKNVGVRIASNDVISHLDLSVEDGEFLVLLGPSGCGKSTLLHAIAGLIELASGEIHIGSTDMTNAEPSDRGIGMVFQSYALYPTMTVEQNMSFGLRVRGLAKKDIKKRVDDVARILQLESLLKRKPNQLSGGQRQRVAIGRALMRDANVFLFDEPLSNLDAQLRTDLRRELKLLHKSLGATMIYVTHDQVEAMTLASRLAVMRNGEILQIGTPLEVYDRPCNVYVAKFLGSPCINLIPAQLVRDSMGGDWRIDAPFTSGKLAYQFAAEPSGNVDVLLGIRPEQIHIQADGLAIGTVILLEPMGSSLTVWLDFNGMKLSAIVVDSVVVEVGQSVRFSIEFSKMSMFDVNSERRI
jgi:multiple sugar transport system ATP-binding protein